MANFGMAFRPLEFGSEDTPPPVPKSPNPADQRRAAANFNAITDNLDPAPAAGYGPEDVAPPPTDFQRSEMRYEPPNEARQFLESTAPVEQSIIDQPVDTSQLTPEQLVQQPDFTGNTYAPAYAKMQADYGDTAPGIGDVARALLGGVHTAIGAPAAAVESLPAKYTIAPESLGGPVVGADESLGDVINRQSAPVALAGHLATGAVAYGPFLVLGKALGISDMAINALFAGDAAVSSKPYLDAYENGDMSAKEALIGALKTAGPQFAPLAIHAVGALHTAPPLDESLARMGGLTGERGSLTPGEGEPGPEPGAQEAAGAPKEAAQPEVPAAAGRGATAPSGAPQEAVESIIPHGGVEPSGAEALGIGKPAEALPAEQQGTTGEPPGVKPYPADINQPAGGTPSPLNAIQKIVRYAARASGTEGALDAIPGLEGTPKPVLNVLQRVARTRAADITNAAPTGSRLQVLEDAALADGPPTVAKGAPAETVDAARVMTDAQKLRAAQMYPHEWNTTPAQDAFIAAHRAQLASLEGRGKAVGLEPGPQVTDPEYVPRIVLGKDGVPVPDSGPGGFRKERTTGNYYQFVLGGHEEPPSVSQAYQYHAEATGAVRANYAIIDGLKRLGDFDGKGAAVKNAVPNTPAAEGYSAVPGMSVPDPNTGKAWLARNGSVQEGLLNAYSPGVGDVGKVLLAPGQIARESLFALGGFHSVYENVAAASRDPVGFRSALGTELTHVFSERNMEQFLVDNEAPIDLNQKLGAQYGFVSGKGGARTEIALGKGVPEQTSMIGKIPLVGKALSTVQRFTFQRVVPTLQFSVDDAIQKDWMLKHPQLVPENLAELMATPEGRQVIADSDTPFSRAMAGIVAEGNHAAGFSENTQGLAERQMQGGVFATPTIMRAMIAHVADVFRKPGDLQGTRARIFWRNAALAGAGVSVGGTLALQGGPSQYTDPTSPKFVLNPAAGKYFMAIVHKDGTTTSVVPSPIRSPLATIFSGPAAAASAALNGESPGAIMHAGIGTEYESGKAFLGNRLNASVQAVSAARQAGGSIEHAAKAALLKYATSNEPIFTQPLADNPPTSPSDLPDVARQMGESFAGVRETPPTKTDTADLALRNAGVADGLMAPASTIADAYEHNPSVRAALNDKFLIKSTGFAAMGARGFQSPGWQKTFSDAGLTNAAKYPTLAKLREAYIAHYAPQIAQRDGTSLTIAEAEANRAFGELPVVRDFDTALKEARLQFIRDHPHLFEDIKAFSHSGGLTREEQDILTAAAP